MFYTLKAKRVDTFDKLVELKIPYTKSMRHANYIKLTKSIFYKLTYEVERVDTFEKAIKSKSL